MTPKLLADERADEQAAVLPPGISIAGVEADPGRCDRGRVVNDRIVHPWLGRLADAALNFFLRQLPPLVVAFDDDVDLVAARRSVLRLPQRAGDRLPRE